MKRRTRALSTLRKRPRSKAKINANTYYTSLRLQYLGEDNSWWLYTESRGVTGPHTLEDCELFTHNSNGDEPVFVVHSKHISDVAVPWVSVLQHDTGNALAYSQKPNTPPRLAQSRMPPITAAKQWSWWRRHTAITLWIAAATLIFGIAVIINVISLYTLFVLAGTILGFVAGGFVFFVFFERNGCLSIILPPVASIAVFYFFMFVAQPFEPAKTPEEIEGAKWASRRHKENQRDWFIRKMNEAIAKNHIDEALIWNDKALKEQREIDSTK